MDIAFGSMARTIAMSRSRPGGLAGAPGQTGKGVRPALGADAANPGRRVVPGAAAADRPRFPLRMADPAPDRPTRPDPPGRPTRPDPAPGKPSPDPAPGKPTPDPAPGKPSPDPAPAEPKAMQRRWRRVPPDTWVSANASKLRLPASEVMTGSAELQQARAAASAAQAAALAAPAAPAQQPAAQTAVQALVQAAVQAAAQAAVGGFAAGQQAIAAPQTPDLDATA